MKFYGIKETKYHYFDNDLEGEYDFFNVFSFDDEIDYVGIKKTEKSIAEKLCSADLGSDFNDISAKEQAERIVKVAIERFWYDENYFEWGKIDKKILDIVFSDPRDAKKYAQMNRLKEFEVFEFKKFNGDFQ